MTGGPNVQYSIVEKPEYLNKLLDESNAYDENQIFVKAHEIAKKMKLAGASMPVEYNTALNSALEKKAAKRARQKQKRKNEKLINELHHLEYAVSRYHLKMSRANIELNALKTVKEPDNKRIIELEEMIKEWNSSKAELESAFRKRFSDLRDKKVEFHYIPLPEPESWSEVTDIAQCSETLTWVKAGTVPYMRKSTCAENFL